MTKTRWWIGWLGAGLVALMALSTMGCALTVREIRVSAFQREATTLSAAQAEQQLLADRAVLALYCGEQPKASDALVAVGVPRPEAERRVLAALAAGITTVNAGCARPAEDPR